MTHFLFAVTVFIAAHVALAYRPWRAALAAPLGERRFLMAYGLLSTVLFVWLFVAYFDAPYVQVWPYAPWTRWVPIVVMVPVAVLLAAGFSSPNPLSIGIGGRRYDPTRPGIVAVTRHPLIWALLLWALAHIPPNGDVASLVLFGLLALLSAYGPYSLDAKRRARLGERWEVLAQPTSNLPFAALARGRADWRTAWIGWLRLFGGAILYLVILFGHEYVIGIDPLAF